MTIEEFVTTDPNLGFYYIENNLNVDISTLKEYLAKLTQCEYLHLSGFDITLKNSTFLKLLKNLQVLTITESNFQDFEILKNIKDLRVFFSHFKNKTPKNIRYLQSINLKKFEINYLDGKTDLIFDLDFDFLMKKWEFLISKQTSFFGYRIFDIENINVELLEKIIKNKKPFKIDNNKNQISMDYLFESNKYLIKIENTELQLSIQQTLNYLKNLI